MATTYKRLQDVVVLVLKRYFLLIISGVDGVSSDNGVLDGSLQDSDFTCSVYTPVT